jgi:hypothetical protein
MWTINKIPGILSDAHMKGVCPSSYSYTVNNMYACNVQCVHRIIVCTTFDSMRNFQNCIFPVSNVRFSLKFTIIVFYLKISSVEMDLPESGVIRQIFIKGRSAEISAKFSVPLSGESHLSLATSPCVGNYDRICKLRNKKVIKNLHRPDLLCAISKTTEHSLPLFLLIKTPF